MQSPTRFGFSLDYAAYSIWANDDGTYYLNVVQYNYLTYTYDTVSSLPFYLYRPHENHYNISHPLLVAEDDTFSVRGLGDM
jgi:hypothetical protein